MKKRISSSSHKPEPPTERRIKTLALDSPEIDGLAVIGGKVPLHVVDDGRRVHKVIPGGTLSFCSTSITGGQVGHAEVPGFRQAPPSSVLWLDISGERDESATVVIDAGGILRNAARLGRPTILVCLTSAKAPGKWSVVNARQQFALRSGSHLLVIGVGHGVSVDPARIFSSLLQTAAIHRQKATKRRGRSDAK